MEEVNTQPRLTIPGYEILELVGRGGMGKVYRAKHIELDRIVAVKVLAHEPDEKLLARFREEARAVAKLQHPNITQLYETGIADGSPFFAQEFIDGGSLADKIGGQPQDPRLAAAIVETIAQAIQHSHDHGILHRDLKPGNVLLTANGTPKVTDFGLAKQFTPSTVGVTLETQSDGLTRTGEILGTPSYMPPEQASGVTSYLGPTADVYSLGAILYETITGRPPFQASDALQTLFMVLSMEPVPPRTLLPKLPLDLDTICLKCLEKSAKRRYASAAELAEDLRRFRVGEPIVARPVSWLERIGKLAKRRKTATALVALSFVFLLMIIGVGILETANAIRLRKANTQLEASNTELSQLNKDLEKSRSETEVTLDYALNTMDQYHFELSDKLKQLPQGEKLRLEVLQQARTTLDDIYQKHPTRERVWEFLMTGYHQLGGALYQIGNEAEAVEAYGRSAEAAGWLGEAHPKDVRFQAARGMSLIQRAGGLYSLGRNDEADPCRDEGIRLANALDRTDPNDAQVLQLNLMAIQYIYQDSLRGGEISSFIPLYRRWVEIYTRLAKVQPDVETHLLKALESELTLAGLYSQTMKFEDAELILSRAKPKIDGLPDSQTPAVRLLRASYHEAVGALADAQIQPELAEKSYRLALNEYENLNKDFPNSPNYRRYLINIWSKIGYLWAASKQPEKGLTPLKTSRELLQALIRDYPDNVQDKKTLDFLDQQIQELALKEN